MGWEHTISDLLTIHDYDQDHKRFYERWNDVAHGIATIRPGGRRPMWNDLLDRPVLITEYGGIALQGGANGRGGIRRRRRPEALAHRVRQPDRCDLRFQRGRGFCYSAN